MRDQQGQGMEYTPDHIYLLRRREGSHNLPYLENWLLSEGHLIRGVIGKFRSQGEESVYSLTGELIGSTDNRGLSNTLMHDEGALDFGHERR